MMPLSLFRARNFRYGNLVTAAAYAGISLGTFSVTVFIQEAGGFSATKAGFAALPLPVVMLLLAAQFGKLAGIYGPRLFMTAGPLICGAGFALMFTVSPPLNFLTQMLPGLLVFSVGLAVMVAPLTSAVLGSLRPEEAGIGSAVNNAVSRVAGLVAIAMAGTISGGALDFPGFQRTVLATAVLFAAAGLLAFVGIRTQPSQVSGADAP
jgi:predicted MFS family arabinose efflux permease